MIGRTISPIACSLLDASWFFFDGFFDGLKASPLTFVCPVTIFALLSSL